MAVLFMQTMPEGVPVQMTDEVTDEMALEGNPPDGLIVHTHFVEDGRVKIVDIWESEEARQNFEAALLGPAVQKITERHGIDTSGSDPPVTTSIEIHRLVRGR